MGVDVSLDVFQENMVNLMEGLEFVHTYLGDLLLICNATFEEHLRQLTMVLRRLRRVGIKVNVENLFFFLPEIEYLGYIMLIKEGVQPVQKKIQAVLDLQVHTTLKQLESVLGIV